MEGKTKRAMFLSVALLFSALSGAIFSALPVSALTLNAIGPNTSATRNRILLWVRNDDTVTHEDGDVVVYKDDDNDGVDISTTVTANDGLVAGVVYGDDIASNTWGWIQVHGYHDSITIGVANSAGDALVTSTTGEAAGVYSVAQATGTAANQSNIFGVFAVALEATTSSTTVKGFILR